MGMFPPGRTDLGDAQRVIDGMCDAHRRAVEAIRSSAPGVPVGLTLSMTDYQPVDGGAATVDQTRAFMEDPFLDVTNGDDFVGVQAYSRMLIGPRGPVGNAPDSIVLPMGYEYWPEALAAVVRRAWTYTGGSTPIHVTENGIGTDDDTLRVSYVETALSGVLDCIADGIDVRGYTYWSLLDNFEWAFGYGPRFGLVAVDRETFTRTPKPSAARYAEIVAANAL
jgi:beta-glucosidase